MTRSTTTSTTPVGPVTAPGRLQRCRPGQGRDIPDAEDRRRVRRCRVPQVTFDYRAQARDDGPVQGIAVLLQGPQRFDLAPEVRNPRPSAMPLDPG